jgi:titin
MNCGLALTGQGNTIGGDRTKGKGPSGEGNLFNGNYTYDIMINSASNNLIKGNYIGTDVSGKKKIGNPPRSISVEVGSSHNRIEGNVIAAGILINDFYSSYNEVVGNYIGTDVTGRVAFDGDAGILVMTSFNKIGGISPEERNVINGKVVIFKASDVLVLGNYIGTDSTGKKAFGTNQQAVVIDQGGRHNFIGGTTEAEHNVINGRQIITIGEFSEYNFYYR